MIDLTKKKILVTGANGFLGKYLIKNLTEKRKVLKKNLFLPTSKDLDLKKWKDCKEATQKQDIVIHLAAKVGGIGLNKEKPGELFYENALMGIQLMEASRQNKIEKFITIGTVCAYPKFTPTPFKENYLWNGYPEETNAPYGLAKKMLLTQSIAYRDQYNFNAIYLLLANLYGPEDNSNLNYSHVIPALIEKIINAKKENKNYIEVWGTGKATREFLYVEDAVEGILLATENYNKLDPINIGSGKEISIKDLIKLICRLMNFKGKILFNQSKPDGQPKRVLDISKAKKEFNFIPQVDLEKGLLKTISYYEKKKINY